jgi:hypothetical protein
MPRKPPEEFRVVLSGRVPPDVKRAILAIANSEGLSMSRIVSRLLEAGLFYERNLAPKKYLKV